MNIHRKNQENSDSQVEVMITHGQILLIHTELYHMAYTTTPPTMWHCPLSLRQFE